MPLRNNHSILDLLSEENKLKIVKLGKPLEFEKKDHLFLKGDLGQEFYIIRKGSIVISTVSAQGKQITLNSLKAGDAFGEIAMLDQSIRTADAWASAGTKIVVISRSDFLRFLKEHPNLYTSIIELLCKRLRWISAQVESFAFTNSLDRIVTKLIQLAAQEIPEENIELAISQDELAKMLGLSREIVNKNLQQLQADSAISLARKKIFIPDIRKLKSLQKEI